MGAVSEPSGIGFDGLRLIDRPWFPYLCTEVENWQWRAEIRHHFNLWVVLGGEGYLDCDEGSYRLHPGLVFVFSPGQRVSAAHYSGRRITRFAAHFWPTQGGVDVPGGLPFPILGREIAETGPLERSIEAIMRQAFAAPGQNALLEARLLLLLRRVCGEREAPLRGALNPAIAAAVRLIREDPAGMGPVDALARRVGMSRSHFDREFSRQVGQPPKRFLLGCRMAEARRLLESTDLRVGEIAERLGYADIYFFSRQFKASFGTSPLGYRSKMS